ncbi:MAG: phosphoribosylanthranilate isomerase [Chloroflexota bacterium]|nr:phosphoribosylanthranilate isomerase [Chloroflexota bacterium]MDE2962018.1 phosphoribosylanthranilate isomerase [Chloroflexota bacterium]
MEPTTVKICGVRRLEDALVASRAGADYFGMVFVPGRRRRIEPEAARLITDGLRGGNPEGPKSVGLFGDQPLDEVLDTIDAARLDYTQLCGDEPLDYCRAVLGHAGVIKVLHVSNDDLPDAVADRIDAFAAAGCTVTLDSQVAGLHGGTGQSFDWRIAAQLAAAGRRFLLAGGLTPDNVAEAVSAVHPWGVDVSSGVETDGVQDAVKIRQFVANARSLD